MRPLRLREPRMFFRKQLSHMECETSACSLADDCADVCAEASACAS